MATFCFACVFALPWMCVLCFCFYNICPQRSGIGLIRTGLLDVGEGDTAGCFPLMSASVVKMKLIYLERWWSEVRDKVLGAHCDTPHSTHTESKSVAFFFLSRCIFLSKSLCEIQGFLFFCSSAHLFCRSSWKLLSWPLSPSSRCTLLGKTDPPAPWVRMSSKAWWPLSCPTMSRCIFPSFPVCLCPRACCRQMLEKL